MTSSAHHRRQSSSAVAEPRNFNYIDQPTDQLLLLIIVWWRSLQRERTDESEVFAFTPGPPDPVHCILSLGRNINKSGSPLDDRRRPPHDLHPTSTKTLQIWPRHRTMLTSQPAGCHCLWADGLRVSGALCRRCRRGVLLAGHCRTRRSAVLAMILGLSSLGSKLYLASSPRLALAAQQYFLVSIRAELSDGSDLPFVRASSSLSFRPAHVLYVSRHSVWCS